MDEEGLQPGWVVYRDLVATAHTFLRTVRHLPATPSRPSLPAAPRRRRGTLSLPCVPAPEPLPNFVIFQGFQTLKPRLLPCVFL